MDKPYRTFASMIITASIVMFGVMYLNTYALDHVRWSETRAYMTLVMGATMAIVMLAFMLGMYKNQRTNAGIVIGSVFVFSAALWLVRSQATVADVSYMKAMIPHHSIAINNARKASISDPRVRELADGIIASQVREIAEMKALIESIRRDGEQGVEPLPPRADE